MEYSKNDIIHIIGGGASGFSSAFFLIESGHNPEKITIFEKSNRIGGHLCTIYFHVINKNDCRIITEYDIIKENKKIFIEFIDHNNNKKKLDLDSENIVPCDMLATVHGREKFHNLYNMAKHNDLYNVLMDNGQKYTVSCIMNDSIHRTDYIMNPLWWMHLYKTHYMLKKIYSNKAKEYMRYNPKLKYGELLQYLGIEFDDPILTAHHSTIPCLFAISVDDIYDVDAQIISYSTETIMGNYEKSFTFYGFNVYLILLYKKLKSKGVKININYDYFKNNNPKPKHIIYACQPWNLPDTLTKNTILELYTTNYTKGDVFVTHNDFKLDGISSINYIIRDNKQYGVADLDKMRGQKKLDTGAYIMAQAPDAYPVFPVSEQKKFKKLYDFSEVHNMNFHEIDGLKRLSIKHTNCQPFERNIDTIQGTYLYGNDGPKVWFSNATYNFLIHEGAWECSMDVVCKMTGEYQKLIKKGYQHKKLRNRIMPNRPKNIIEEIFTSNKTYFLIFIIILVILLFKLNEKFSFFLKK